jgi:hypothetical protein
VNDAVVENTVLGAIFALVPLVHLMTDSRSAPVEVFDERLVQVASFAPELVDVDVIDAPVTLVVPLLSFAVPLHTPVDFDEVVTFTSPAEYGVLGIEAIAAFTVALLLESALEPEWAAWLQSFARPGLSFTVPVIVHETLLPGPAVMVTGPALAAGTAMKPAAPSAMTAPEAPSHLEIFT